MSRIDDLIRDLCPNGVEYKPLGDVARYSPRKVSAEDLNSTTFVGVDNLVSQKRGRIDATHAPNTSTLTAYYPGNILIGNIRPYLKKVWLADRSGGCSGDVLAIEINEQYSKLLEPQYLYYVLSSDSFFRFNQQNARGAKMPRGDKSAILRYRVPIPPLELQYATVEVMSRLTVLEHKLESKLSSETSLRSTQHTFLKNAILKITSTCPTAPLHELAKFTNGKPHERLATPSGDVALITAKFISRGGIPDRFVRSSDVKTPAASNDIALVMSDLPGGRALAKAFHIKEDGRYAANQRICLLTPVNTSILHPRFLYHTLDRNPKLLAHDNGVDQTHLKRSQIEAVHVPIPSMNEQRYIIGALDKLNASLVELTSCLSSEIEARRKQYEYYRDRLLTFPEKK